MKTSFLEKRKQVAETHKNQRKMIHFDHFFSLFQLLLSMFIFSGP